MNDTTITFAAPWSTLLKWTTAVATTVLLVIAGVGLFSTPPGGQQAVQWVWWWSMVGTPLGVIVFCMACMIKGYELSADALHILRPGWRVRIDLSSLTGAEVNAQAMSRSFRTFGNGGLFCFAGWFRNKTLGSYRAFATDPKRAVVLKLGNKTIVVTPDDPQGFVKALGIDRDA